MTTRLFVSGPLINGAEIVLEGDRARYLGKVLRARVGDLVNLFNGEGLEWRATIVEFRKNRVSLQIGDSFDPGTESPLNVHLIQGISRGERMDFVVQKATELGVARITPVFTEYGVVKLDASRAEKRRAHWEKIAVSACEQSGRTKVPVIDALTPLKHWFGSQHGEADVKLILAPGASTPLATVTAPQNGVCLLIGPEGGFSGSEYDDAEIAGWQQTSLGPRVLRTETAAIAALAVIQFL